MKKMVGLIKNKDLHLIFTLTLSALSLLMSFFKFDFLNFDPAWVAIILCGYPIVKSAIIGLITNFNIKSGVLVSIALFAAIYIDEIFAAGEVAFIMALGELLEERTLAKARAGIEKLANLKPQTARIIINKTEHIVPSQKVQVSDTLRVLAGETIAVDGTIISGQTSINQSVMTGESLPVDKGIGDEVFSGTVNQFGVFEMKATKVGKNSSLQRMIRLVESADASKAKIVGIADKWATWIVVIALVSAIGTWFLTDEIIRSVTILVVFCPCALVLATPTAIMASIGNTTKYGILIKEGDALERLSKIKRFAFDKTGTLTLGKPSVVAVENARLDISTSELLKIVACAELRSEHPLGKAIVSHFKSSSSISLIDPDEFIMIPGSGVKATVSGKQVFAGNKDFIINNEISLSDDFLEKSNVFKNEGCTVIYIAIDNYFAGFIALSDTLRKESHDIIKNLSIINIKTTLLTGDNSRVASHIGKKLGISDIHSECLPENKLSIIAKYHEKNEEICMVGDGINDAPSLKKAYVGIAMGGVGSDIAVDAADIALVADDLKSIPHLIKLSHKTMLTIRWNLFLSMLLNFIAIILAMTGILDPILGALVHNLGSLVVVINSALLLNYKYKTA